MSKIQIYLENIFYLILFIISCLSLFIFYYILSPIAFVEAISCEKGSNLCGFIIIIVSQILGYVAKFMIPILSTYLIIKKNSNSILIKMFNNNKIMTLLLVFFIVFDLLIKNLCFNDWSYDRYLWSFSTVIPYSTIYIVAMINLYKKNKRY